MSQMKRLHDEWGPQAPFQDVPLAPSSGAGVIVRDRDGMGIASVLARRGQYAVFTAKCRQRFGVELASGPRRSCGGGIALIAIGPGAWWATREDAANDLAIELIQAFGECAAISDQSDGQAVLRLSGPKVREALCKLVPIDLHPRAFTVNDVAVTVASHIGVTLWRLQDGSNGDAVFEVAVYRSLAGSFWTVLSDAAAEFGVGRVAAVGPSVLDVSNPNVPERHDSPKQQIMGR